MSVTITRHNIHTMLLGMNVMNAEELMPVGQGSDVWATAAGYPRSLQFPSEPFQFSANKLF